MSDTKPPAELARLQAGFGRSIATPLEFLDEDGNYGLQLERYDDDAVRAIRPRGDKSGAQRLSVYNQQYWFRLLTIMQEEFPLTEALMGIQAFNRFSMAYLDACPPDSARLRDLSNRLEEFCASADINELEREAIGLERIYIDVFDAAALPTPDPSDPDAAARLATKPLRFQPHLHLYDTQHNVVELRRSVKAGDSVTARDAASQPATWVIWRGAGVQAVDLGPLQAQLLRRLFDGESLVLACETLAETLEEAQLEFLALHVQRWFAAWSTAGWFAAPSDL